MMPTHLHQVVAPVEKELAEMENVSKKGFKKGYSVAQDFRSFLNRGNVVDLAVGVVMGSAFTGIVNSLVNDIFSPSVSTATYSGLQYAFRILRCPQAPNGTVTPCNRTTYTTPIE
ncbi:hypothetical protein HK097_003440, partial [Rhizophlyctis rosea]